MAETTQEQQPTEAGPPASADELQLIAALRAGDEAAFVALVDRYHSMLLRLALMYVHSRAVAEEVVQETWLGVLQGLARFEGRSSLKTWIFRILTNRAKTRGQREGRSIAFSDLASAEAGLAETSVDPINSGRPITPPGTGCIWVSYPLEQAARRAAGGARDAGQAPGGHRRTAAGPAKIITLRDIESWSSEEICNMLISLRPTNAYCCIARAQKCAVPSSST
ncbi:MAG: sigma factor [Kouleothrix sp.]